MANLGGFANFCPAICDPSWETQTICETTCDFNYLDHNEATAFSEAHEGC